MTTRTVSRQADLDHAHASIEDVDHIAALVAATRPDWDPGLVRIVLHSHRGQVHAADLACAALRAAQNPALHTPKAIGWRGRHWDGAKTLPPEVQHRERCSICGKVEPRCVMERPGPDDHPFTPTRWACRR